MSTRPNRSITIDRHPETLPLPEGGSLPLRVYGVAGQEGPALVLHFHGGGFIGGSLDSGQPVAEVLASAGATVVALDYPLAPAHPFPAAVEAGYAALLWLERHRRRLAGAQAPLYVAGEDAGANIAAAVALVARDRGVPLLAGQLLLSPMLDACIATASQRAAGEGLPGCVCTEGWRAYLASAGDAVHPYAVPGQAARLAGLPPALLITSQDDPLRDETLAYARRLREAGVAACSQQLALDTGWPRSYAQPDAPWADPLRAALQPLFQPLTV
jgi:acetyl esterase/lipase